MKYRLLDLFCGGGGAAFGYHRAFKSTGINHKIIGVDIKLQPHYPSYHDAEYSKYFEFHQADALTYPLDGFDAVHASPPCQKFSRAGMQWRKAGKEYVDLIEPTRNRLKSTGIPYVIENVPGSPLINPIVLNGAFFGLRVRRVRWFECSFEIPFFLLPEDYPTNFMGRPVKEGIEAITPVGHFSNVKYAQKEMDIDWMNRDELSQSIPPAYTFFIGNQLIKYLITQK